MPEGPETYIICRQLRKLVNQTLCSFECEKSWKTSTKSQFVEDTQKYIKQDVILEDIKARGKQLVLCFKYGESKIYMAVHFMLTGHFFLEEQNNTRAVFSFSDKDNDFTKLYFDDARNFATFRWCDTAELKELLNKIGPSIINCSQKTFVNRLTKLGGDRKIAGVLHEQDIISGIGNYLRAEALYIAKIPPDAKTSDVDLAKLYTAVKKVVDSVLAKNGTEDYKDLYGNVGGYKFKVYGRKIAKNGKATKKIKIGSQSVYYVDF